MTAEECSIDQRPGAGSTASTGCITCGDVAVTLTAVESGDADVRCRAGDGRVEVVGVELVGATRAGDRLVVHAGTAIARLPGEENE